MTPRILSLDPGGTTGWAFIDGTFVITGNIPETKVQVTRGAATSTHLHNALASLRAKYHPDMVVIERMPLRLAPSLRAIVQTCHDSFPQHHLISPGEWKPVSGRVKLPMKMETQHQKDAYRMARFYLFKFWNVAL